jgi:hypothetical protein
MEAQEEATDGKAAAPKERGYRTQRAKREPRKRKEK